MKKGKDSRKLEAGSGQLRKQGNTVGSLSVHSWNFLENPKHAYMLGLLAADGYHRTSSIGLSNIDIELITRFQKFLQEFFDEERLRLRIYYPYEQEFFDTNPYFFLAKKISAYPMRKCSHPALQLYVNSRPFLRRFQDAKQQIINFQEPQCIAAYLAGRFDGDGSIDKDMRRYCRIAYTSLQEANNDKLLLQKLSFKRISVYHYKAARTYCVYISRIESRAFLGLVEPYSLKVSKVYTQTP